MHIFKEGKKKQRNQQTLFIWNCQTQVKDYYRFRYKRENCIFFEKKEMEENTLKDDIDIEK